MRKEVLEIQENEISIEIAGNKVSSIRNKNITKKGARVFKDGKIYLASFVGSIDNQKLIENALENEDGAITYNYKVEAAVSISSTHYLKDKSKDDLYNQYEMAIDQLTKRHPDFIFSGKANIKRVNKKLNFLNEVDLEVNYDFCEWYLTYKHKKSASIIDGYFGAGGIAEFDILPVVEKYSAFLDVFDNIVTLNEGETPVVFVESTPLYRKVLESVRSDFYKKDIGLFKGKLGEKVLSEHFSLLDISFDPEVGAMDLFDADGFSRTDSRLPLIENGVFKSLIADSRNALKFSISKTGNTKRSFDSNTRLGFNTVVAGPGNRSVKEILADLPECIIVEMAAGGDFTDLGDYSTPVQNGFLARNGKIVGKIPQITLTSSVQKMFGADLLEVSSDALSSLDNGPAVFMKMNVLLNKS